MGATKHTIDESVGPIILIVDRYGTEARINDGNATDVS